MLRNYFNNKQKVSIYIDEQRALLLKELQDKNFGEQNLEKFNKNLKSGKNIYSYLLLGNDFLPFIKDNETYSNKKNKELEFLAINQKYNRWVKRLTKSISSGNILDLSKNIVFQKYYVSQKDADSNILNIIVKEHLKKENMNNSYMLVKVALVHKNFYLTRELQDLIEKTSEKNKFDIFVDNIYKHIKKGDDLINFFSNKEITHDKKKAGTHLEEYNAFYIDTITKENAENMQEYNFTHLISFLENSNKYNFNGEAIIPITEDGMNKLNEKFNLENKIIEKVFNPEVSRVNGQTNFSPEIPSSLSFDFKNIYFQYNLFNNLSDKIKNKLYDSFNSSFKKIQNKESCENEYIYLTLGSEDFEEKLTKQYFYYFINDKNLNLDFINHFIENINEPNYVLFSNQADFNKFIYDNKKIPEQMKLNLFNRFMHNEKEEDNYLPLDEFIKYDLPFSFIENKDLSKLKRNDFPFLKRILNREDCPPTFVDQLLKNTSIVVQSIILNKKDISFEQAKKALSNVSDLLFKYKKPNQSNDILSSIKLPNSIFNNMNATSVAPNIPDKYNYWQKAYDALNNFINKIDKYDFTKKMNPLEVSGYINSLLNEQKECKLFFNSKEASKLVKNDNNMNLVSLTFLTGITPRVNHVNFLLNTKPDIEPKYLYEFLQNNTDLIYYVSDVNFLLENINKINKDIVELFISKEYKHRSTKILRHPSLDINFLNDYLDVNKNPWYIVADALRNPNVQLNFVKNFNTNGISKLDEIKNKIIEDKSKLVISKLDYYIEKKGLSEYSKEYITLYQEILKGVDIFDTNNNLLPENVINEINSQNIQIKKLSISKENNIIKKALPPKNELSF